MDTSNLSSLSKAATLEQMGDFWDTHDFTDFDTNAPDVEFIVTHLVAIEAELLTLIEQQAGRRGVTVETLVNLWLQQKLSEEMSTLAA